MKTWNLPAVLLAAGVQATPSSTGAKAEPGYHLLAYHLLNYAACCRTCNSAFKRDFFPITRSRRSRGVDPATLNRQERPLLVYPIGTSDEDPSLLIGFIGVEPCARARSGHRLHRALTTIEFFELGLARGTREDLHRERALTIALVADARDRLRVATTKARRARERAFIESFKARQSPHAACARAFLALCSAEPDVASEIAELARGYLASRRPR